MQLIRWYLPLALGVLAAPITGRAQTPQPRVREIAVLPGAAIGWAVRMPNGHIIIYTVGDSLLAYDPASKRSTLISRRFDGELSVSRAGDRIAFSHRSEEGTDFIWSVPIDPKTGAATGPAQRVSMSPGDTPSFSPDGKLIAFALYTARGNDLAVVPSRGGTEHVLATYTRGIRATSWSADGNWIFAQVGRMDSVQRVPAGGGPSELAISYPGESEGFDGQIAFYRPDLRARAEGRMAYVTPSGTRGAFGIAPGVRWGGDYMGAGSTRALVSKTTRVSTAHVLNLADGTVRDLVPGIAQSRAEAWSPDGHRLALQTGTSEHLEITVMNTDGSQVRHYPVTVYSTAQHVRWSPNGQLLAYYADGGATTLAVLDLAAGTTRVVSSAGPAGFIPDYMWRPNGRSIVLVKRAGNGGIGVYETGIDGVERKLSDIGAELPARPFFVSDQLVLGGTVTERYMIPTSGGTPQKLPGIGRRNAFPGASDDGKWLLFMVRNTDGRSTSVELMTSGGDSLRSLNLPFELGECCWNAPFHPDRQHLILGGTVAGEGTSKLFLVPLNGDPPRVLSQFPRLNGPSYLSLDGKNLVFTSEGPPTSTIYELDLSPILQAIGKHEP